METPASTPMPKIEKPVEKKLNLTLIGFIVLVLILIVSSVSYFLFFNKHKAKTSETKKESTSSASKKNEEIFEFTYVSAQEGLNLREKPSTDSNIILLLPYGTELKIIGTEGSDWYFVEAQTKGFVAKEFTTKEKPSITIKTFSEKESPFSFLYHDVYKIDFTKSETTFEYSFTGNNSFGGFKVATEEGMQTLGNYAIQKYPNGKRSACDVRFGAGRKECEKVEDDTGTTYLVLVDAKLYKFTYLKTEGGVLEDIRNIVFYSLFFK